MEQPWHCCAGESKDTAWSSARAAVRGLYNGLSWRGWGGSPRTSSLLGLSMPPCQCSCTGTQISHLGLAHLRITVMFMTGDTYDEDITTGWEETSNCMTVWSTASHFKFVVECRSGCTDSLPSGLLGHMPGLRAKLLLSVYLPQCVGVFSWVFDVVLQHRFWWILILARSKCQASKPMPVLFKQPLNSGFFSRS